MKALIESTENKVDCVDSAKKLKDYFKDRTYTNFINKLLKEVKNHEMKTIQYSVWRCKMQQPIIQI